MAPIVASWRLFLSLLWADNRLVHWPEGSLFCRQKWCLRQKQSWSQPQPCCFGLFSAFSGIKKKKSRIYINLEVLWDLFKPPPLRSPWPTLDQGDSENKMLKFSFPWEQCHISQLKKTSSQHKLSVQLLCPLIIFHLVLLFKGIIWVKCLHIHKMLQSEVNLKM